MSNYNRIFFWQNKHVTSGAQNEGLCNVLRQEAKDPDARE